MPRQKLFDYYMDEVDWSYGQGYRIRIPYVDATGARHIYYQTFSTRKLGLDMVATKRLAKAERDRLIQVQRGREAPADPPSVFSDKRWFPLGHPHKIIPGQGFDAYGRWRHIQGWSAICQPCAVSRPPVLAF
jgi:hypothetical protein